MDNTDEIKEKIDSFGEEINDMWSLFAEDLKRTMTIKDKRNSIIKELKKFTHDIDNDALFYDMHFKNFPFEVNEFTFREVNDLFFSDNYVEVNKDCAIAIKDIRYMSIKGIIVYGDNDNE